VFVLVDRLMKLTHCIEITELRNADAFLLRLTAVSSGTGVPVLNRWQQSSFTGKFKVIQIMAVQNLPALSTSCPAELEKLVTGIWEVVVAT
jgi:hypothetical protein